MIDIDNITTYSIVKPDFCPRCLEVHSDLPIRKLLEPDPDDGWDHWFTCPTTNEPAFIMFFNKHWNQSTHEYDPLDYIGCFLL